MHASVEKYALPIRVYCLFYNFKLYVTDRDAKY